MIFDRHVQAEATLYYSTFCRSGVLLIYQPDAKTPKDVCTHCYCTATAHAIH